MTEAEFYSEYKGVYVPKSHSPPESLQYMEGFAFRPDDIIIATYPRSGTTWMQEIVPLIISEGDMQPVLSIPNWDRLPWLEGQRAILLNLEQRPSPRYFATHLHYSMMPESFFKVKPKVIYVTRNPKDVFTSSYHYYGMASYLVNPGTPDEFLSKFLDGKVLFGSWFDHVKGWISAQDQDQTMYISYEEMILDLQKSISKISSFLGKSLSQEVIGKIADDCKFHNMKQNNMSNYSMVPEEYMDQKKSGFLRKVAAWSRGAWNEISVFYQEFPETGGIFSPTLKLHISTVFKEKMGDVAFKFAWDD